MTTVPPPAKESEHANVDDISGVSTKSPQNNRQRSAATILTGYFPKLLKQIQVHVAGDQSTYWPLTGLSTPKLIARPGGKGPLAVTSTKDKIKTKPACQEEGVLPSF